MNINIFILCFNESILLPDTIKHYRKYLPNAKIVIFDNESTDNSVEIAKNLSCEVKSFASKNEQNDYIFRDIKNNWWKEIKDGWIIMCDMDEWLCVTEKELEEEYKNGVGILNTKGYEIIGDSKNIDLTDIDLHTINKGTYNLMESKKLCFHTERISEINYEMGAHFCKPIAKSQTETIKYSEKIYINKHMNYLGLPYIINKMKKRYERTHQMRTHHYCTHYTNNIQKITSKYYELLNASETI
jgi:glycosyltransferase involved in cell wall biosynthesis